MAELGSPVRVKVCGLTRVEDARLASRAGASYVGAVLSPGFRRTVDPARGAELAAAATAEFVAVMVDAGIQGAKEVAEETGARILQLHGKEAPGELRTLAGEGPWSLWKALKVRSSDDVRRAIDSYAEVAQGLLLEGFHPGSGGGVGASFPWEVVAPVRDEFPNGLALIVAGGLNPLNVRQAIDALQPHVVDVSSGVESAPGVKDPRKVLAFVDAALGTADEAVPVRKGEG